MCYFRGSYYEEMEEGISYTDKQEDTKEQIKSLKDSFISFLDKLDSIAREYTSLNKSISEEIQNYKNKYGKAVSMGEFFEYNKDSDEVKNIYEKFIDITKRYVEIFEGHKDNLINETTKLNNVLDIKHEGLGIPDLIRMKIGETFFGEPHNSVINEGKILIEKIEDFIKSSYTNLLKCDENGDIRFYVPSKRGAIDLWPTSYTKKTHYDNYPDDESVFEGYCESLKNLDFTDPEYCSKLIELFNLGDKIQKAKK